MVTILNSCLTLHFIKAASFRDIYTGAGNRHRDAIFLSGRPGSLRQIS